MRSLGDFSSLNKGNRKGWKNWRKAFVLTSVLMDEEGVENTATLILRNDNPDFDIIVSEYSQTVRFLSQKPNEHGWLSNTHLPPCASAALSAHKQSHYVRQTIATLLRKTPRVTPQGANFRASESKASSSLECSAERSRKSTQLKLACSYRTAGLPVKSFPSEKGRI